MTSVYADAISYLEEHGWNQHSYFSAESPSMQDDAAHGQPACVLGALWAVLYLRGNSMIDWDTKTWSDATCAVERTLTGPTGTWPGYYLADWNDKPERSAEDVILLLKQTQAREEEENNG